MIRILAVLLAAQLALTVYLYWPQDTERGAPTSLLEALPRDAVTSIEVSDGEARAMITRSGSEWQMESGLPADPARMTTLLSALLENDPGFAIATSDSAAERFKVADSSYERRIRITGSGLTSDVYIGTSPVFRKVHARRDGDSAIYVIDLNSFDAPTSEAGWLDRGLAALPDIDELSINDAMFTRESGIWTTENSVASESGAPENADPESLTEALATLQVTGLANAEDKIMAGEGETLLRLEARSKGKTTALTLIENDGRYFLRSSAFDALFALSDYDAERLLNGADKDIPDA